MKKPLRIFLALSILCLCSAPLEASPASDVIEGWGVQKYANASDLARAIHASREAARLDLAANILTFVKVRTVEKVVQDGDQVREQFKKVTVTKVVSVLREVRLQDPKIDEAKGLVITKATVTLPVARAIIQDCLARMEEEGRQRKENEAAVAAITDSGRNYYQKKVVEMADMDQDLGKLLERLRKDLLTGALRDILDVRNAIQTAAFENYPREGRMTLLAYIDMQKYSALVQNYDAEVYLADQARQKKEEREKRKWERRRFRDPSAAPSIIPQYYPDPATVPKVAESYVPDLSYDKWGFRLSLAHMGGAAEETVIGITALHLLAEGRWGLNMGLGFELPFNPDKTIQQSPYTAAGYVWLFTFHFPLEVEGIYYFAPIKSGEALGYAKLGLVGVYSLAMARDDLTGDEVFLFSSGKAGLKVGGGLASFMKYGLHPYILDMGVDIRWFPNGFHGEGSAVGAGFYFNYFL